MVACIDDEATRSLIPRMARPIVTYGFSEDANYRAVDVAASGELWRFTVERPEPHMPIGVSLKLPGLHNVQNATAAIAVATEEGVDDEAIVAGFERFRGVGRRFETSSLTICGRSITMVDDYGHHPTELSKVLATVREIWPDRRVLMIYQPHRYSRMAALLDEFVDVLASVDSLVLLDTYSAGEAPIEGADSKALARRIADRGRNTQPLLVHDVDEATAAARRQIEDGDVVIVQGAGNVSRVAGLLEGASG